MSPLTALKILPNVLFSPHRCLSSSLNNFLNLSVRRKIKPIRSVVFFSDTFAPPKTINSKEDVINLITGSGCFSFPWSYFLNNPNYNASVYRPERLISNHETNCESLKMLRKIASTGEDVENVQNIQTCLKDDLNTVNFEDLIQILGLTLCCSRMHQSIILFDDLIKDLDNYLLEKGMTYKKDELLMIFDLLYFLDKKKKLRFCYKIYKLCIRFHQLNPWQFVHASYFFARENVKQIKDFQFPIQKYCMEIIPKINATDLGIIAYGLHANSIALVCPGLSQSIVTKTLEEIDTIHSESLSSIFWCLAGHDNREKGEPIMHLQENLMDHVSKFDSQLLIMLANLSMTCVLLNYKLFEKILARHKEIIKEAPPQHITRLLEVLVRANIRDDEYINLAIEQMKLHTSSPPFTQIGAAFLRHLLIYKIYPKDLLERVVNHNYIQTINPGASTRHWWFLNCSLEIEKPEFYLKIEDKKAKKLWRRAMFSPEKLTSWNRLFLDEIEKTLSTIYEKSIWRRILPHFAYRGLLVFDKNFNLKDIPEEYRNIEKWQMKKPVDDNFWICLVTVFKSFHQNLPQPDLICQTEIRQLTALGFIPVCVYQTNWFDQKEQKSSYLENLINEALQGEQKRRLAA